MSISVDVIVPTLNDGLQLQGLLTSLRGQDAKITVADGGSNDDTLEIAISNGAEYVLFGGQKDAIGCTNSAAFRSNADVLFMVASDVRLPRGIFEKIRHAFEADSSLIGLTGRAVPYDGPTLCKVEYAVYSGLSGLLDPFRFVSSGSFLAVRRSAFEQLGGFPDTYNNDGQFGARLKRTGKTRFDRHLFYYVSARRYRRVGFFWFNRQFLYVLENFVPVPFSWFTRLGEHLRKEHHAS